MDSGETGASSGDAQDLRELAEMIAAFDASTTRLKVSHDALQERVAELTGELAEKNQALTASLEEVSSLKNTLADILGSITDGVVAIDLDRRLVAVNRAAAEVLPALGEAGEGTPVAEAFPAGAGEMGRLLLRALTDEEALTNREVILEDAAGRGRTLLVGVSPVRGEDGEILGAVETFRDLTEVKSLEAELARKERLAALGEMAAGVAHEIRNPLGGIELYASLLRKETLEESRRAELAGKIMSAAASLNRIVTDMLTFTRSREPSWRPVPVEHVFRTALDLAQAEIRGKNLEVREEYATDGARLPLDPDLLSRALLNVVRNAAEVSPEGGAITVRSKLEAHPGGRMLVLAVLDEGPGVPEEVAPKIFHPFFTTRKDGTGLGLAIVHKIAQDHGGAVRVEPNEPRGAAFIFRLPVREGLLAD